MGSNIGRPPKPEEKKAAKESKKGREEIIRMKIKRQLIYKLIIHLIVIILFAGSAGYGANDIDGLQRAIKAGVEGYLVGILFLGSNRAFILAIVYGCGLGYIKDDPYLSENLWYSFTRIVATILAFGGVIGISIGVVTEKRLLSERCQKYFGTSLSRIVIFLWVAFLLAVFIYLGSLYIQNYTRSFPSVTLFLEKVHHLFLAIVGEYFFPPLTMLMGFLIGVRAGNILKIKIEPGLLIYGDIIPYLKAMVVPLIGFAFGYIILAFVFANFYWASWRANPCCSFNNLSDNPSFVGFFYFSIVTITTLGYGDITPASSMTRILASIEVILGIGWITIMFAVILVHLQPRFVEIVKKQSTRQSDMDKHTDSK
jgi:hypothetical protein